MSKITPKHFINCSNCNKTIIKCYYEIGFIDVICIDCMVVANHGFPVGKSTYIPCKFCEEPNIRWHETNNLFGEKIDGCFIHNTKSDSDDDYNFYFYD